MQDWQDDRLPIRRCDIDESMSLARYRISLTVVLDQFFFIFAAGAALWLAWLLFTEAFDVGWAGTVYLVAFWALLAYFVLPRVHRIFAAIYLPGYFIGRTRTSDGLLGDPVNVAVLGEQSQIETVMAAAGWTRADPVDLWSSMRIVASVIMRRSYPTAPVSPLFLFGRLQDLAFQQEVAGNPAKRHHIRLWRTPDGWLLPGGTRVDWLGAATFDRAVGFSLFTLQITHKIDADIDVERDYVTASVMDADIGAELEVMTDFATGYHARNGGGDSVRTDGSLPVIDLRKIHRDD
ncbi:LssY C-terminal domain-containing protein [Corynebacterium provencense]|nr:LssY C-terminal domain-containing protein [Corynebacterium provencense]